MQVPTYKRLMLFSGTANYGLAEEIATHLGMKLGESRSLASPAPRPMFASRSR